MARKQLQSLTEPMYYILLSLLKPLHGYGIMKNIELVTKGRVAVGPGTLYSLLSRFEKEGIVKKVATEENRKIYVLTKQGRELLQVEFHRLKQLIDDGSELNEVKADEKN